MNIADERSFDVEEYTLQNTRWHNVNSIFPALPQSTSRHILAFKLYVLEKEICEHLVEHRRTF